MGTQQLLLIVLGVVVVAVMVFAGFSVYNTYMEQSSRDQLISTIYDLAVNAQQYYKKPRELGGGGQTFSGWQMPSQINVSDLGRFRSNVRTDRINFTVTGNLNGINGKTKMRMTAIVNSDGVSIRIRN